MGNGRGKPKYEKLEDIRAEYEIQFEKYKAMANKETKAAIAQAAKIHELSRRVTEAEEGTDEAPLSEGVLTYLKKFYVWEKYKRYALSEGQIIGQFQKGRYSEGESIKMISELDGRDCIKNGERFANDFLCGKPDLLQKSSAGNILYVIDTKTSWDIESFADNFDNEISQQYWWQLQGYFDLTGASSGEISFCLISTPQYLIDEYIRRMREREDIICDPEEVKRNVTFDDIPMLERRVKFTVERDDEAIQRIHLRVNKCREHLMEMDRFRSAPLSE